MIKIISTSAHCDCQFVVINESEPSAALKKVAVCVSTLMRLKLLFLLSPSWKLFSLTTCRSLKLCKNHYKGRGTVIHVPQKNNKKTGKMIHHCSPRHKMTNYFRRWHERRRQTPAVKTDKAEEHHPARTKSLVLETAWRKCKMWPCDGLFDRNESSLPSARCLYTRLYV